MAGHPIHEYAANHKNELISLIKSELTRLPDQKAQLLAENLVFLLDGAIVAAQVRGARNAALEAKRMASVLLRAYKIDQYSLPIFIAFHKFVR